MNNKKNKKTKRCYSMIATTGTLFLLSPVLSQETFANDTLSNETKLEVSDEKSKMFVLSDWLYSETDTTITLTKYNGVSTSIYIPGEVNGKQVVIPNLKIFPSSMTHLTIEEVNGKKVGLESKSLFRTFSRNDTVEVLNLNGLDTSKVTDMEGVFYRAKNLQTLEVGDWDVSNVTNMSAAFEGVSNLSELDIAQWDVSSVTDMSNLFAYMTNIKVLELDNWDVSNVTDMTRMFFENLNLEFVGVAEWDVSNVTTMFSMFDNTKALKTVDVSSWNLENLTTSEKMFNRSGIAFLDVSQWNTSNIVDMSSMFSDASNLKALDVSQWDVSNVTNMYSMFNGLYELEELDVSQWDVSNVTNMRYMFYSLEKVTKLDVHQWDVSSVTDMGWMFSWMTSLTELDLSQWDVSNVIDMGGMFKRVAKLETLDLSDWDVSNVRVMMYMFGWMDNLKVLDLSNWKLSNNIFMLEMFECFEPIEGEETTGEQVPLLIVSNDEQIKNYDFEADGRTNASRLIFDANGGFFSDGTTQQQSTGIRVIESKEVPYVQQLIHSIMETNEIPVSSKYEFLNWKTTENASMGLMALYEDLNATYLADWKNSSPVIEVFDQVIAAGHSFDPLKNATAFDSEDGEIVLTEANVISNTVDVSKVGTYEIVYQVTDSYGATTTKTITVTVESPAPIIIATDLSLTIGDLFDPLKYASALDDKGNSLEIKVIKNTVDPSKVGDYEVIYQATNQFGVTISKSIRVSVLPMNTSPITEGGSNNDEKPVTPPVEGVEESEKPDESNPVRPEQGETVITGVTTITSVLFGILSICSGVCALWYRKK